MIPYLRELVKGGHEMELLTFEPQRPGEWEREVREGLRDDGIGWHRLRYHKRPSVPATLFDIANGARYVRKLTRKNKYHILHCRSHVPMMMAVLASKATSITPKLLFDIRGFVPEEYVDAGVWTEGGSVYRCMKYVERRLMSAADGYVVLTEAARERLFPESAVSGRTDQGKAVAVIPCCVDFERRFSSDRSACRSCLRSDLGIENRIVFVHVGALGGLYLSTEIADLLAMAKLKNPLTFALFLTQSDPDLIAPLLVERGFRDSDYLIDRVPASKVERYLYGSDIGISFVKSSYATISRSPTKIPEYWAAGLPTIANAGVGDLDVQLNGTGLGVIVEQFRGESYEKAIDLALALVADPLTPGRCRGRALSGFDLVSVGGVRYTDIYDMMLDSR